ncbi:MAG: glutathione peroxidase [Dehalococcoidia bacterium]|nr:MAG: glutathione peroxidase [Dehalococcoidia bacterium]
MLDRTMKRLDGTEQSLRDFAGQVLLLVNVASKCGHTPQYAKLEALYQQYKDRGFSVLGFPANNFGGQEPGSDAEIAEFCSLNYGVTFPMFSKISVKGDDIHPLYAEITSLPEPIGGEVRWNFQKYVVDRSGKVVAKFDPRTQPDDPELVQTIERCLEQSVPEGASSRG